MNKVTELFRNRNPNTSRFQKRFARVGLFVLITCLCCGSPIQSSLTPKEKAKILAQIGETLNRRAFALGADFSEWPAHLEKHKAALDAASTDLAFARATHGILAEFGVSHLGLSPPKHAKAFRQAKEIGLIGVYTTKTDNGFLVNRIAKASPAYLAGIRKLDIVLEIDGYLPSEAYKHRDPNATTRHIKWKRGETLFEKHIEIRPFTPSDPPSLQWLDNEIAVIRIMSFGHKQYKLAKVSKLMREAKRANGIVIDLRGNGGGFIHHYLHLSSRFSPRSEAFHLRIDRNTYNKAKRKTGNAQPQLEELLAFARKGKPWGLASVYKGPTVVLIDGYSASAADIFPASMKEVANATIIGRPSRGALLASTFKALPHGFSLQFPIWEIVTPTGQRLEGNGLKPDIELSIEQTADDAYIYSVAKKEIERRLSNAAQASEN